MKQNRKVKNLQELTNGPGKLCKALKIDIKLNGKFVTLPKSPIRVFEREEGFKISSSHRIGVTRDLKRKLKFSIKGNKFVSKL